MNLFKQQLHPRWRGELHSKEDEMTKNYSRVDIEGSGGRLSMADFSIGAIAVVGSIVALKMFLLAFLLVSF